MDVKKPTHSELAQRNKALADSKLNRKDFVEDDFHEVPPALQVTGAVTQKYIEDYKDIAMVEMQRYNIPVEELTVDTEKVELTREQQLEKFKSMYTVADYERDLRKGLLLGKPLPFYNLNLLKLISEDIVNEQEIT